ncbi:TonB family protein [Spirosoma oryzae]|uniref:TonB family protein n=1 Tax=Spirosoma oryzae TaxID=1469603 RepID=A0A2T0S8J8_9BACT|nr:M56 family metallopeptidase [Spirosoma oryzae]PRY29750.1 TonB family protein [Spirosoma oryzae]
MTILDYLFRSTLYLLLFAGCYQLLLRRTTYFGLNRAYLLLTLLASGLLPFATVPESAGETLSTGVITLPAITVGREPQLADTNWSVLTVLWAIYGAGVLLMLLRLAWRLGSVHQLIRQGAAQPQNGYTLIRLAHNQIASFSFGQYLVLNRTDAHNPPDALLRHEEAHIRQRHTIDVLIVEFAQALFWFNPTLWYYKQAVQEVHEFLADRVAAIQLRTGYAHQLVSYALDTPVAALTTPFYLFSTLKQRITMLQKPASPRRFLLGYALVLPLAATLVMCTQSERDQPLTQDESTNNVSVRKPARIDGEVYTVVEHQPEFPGGMKALSKYLSENLKYPSTAVKANAAGKVFVSFIVTKTGEIADVQLVKGIGFGADEEAVRVVNKMPRWKPGRQGEESLNVQYVLPIDFELDSVSEPDGYLKDIKTIVLNGKEVTKDEFKNVSTDAIKSVDVDKANSTIKVTTK